jgi:hypothetical protein
VGKVFTTFCSLTIRGGAIGFLSVWKYSPFGNPDDGVSEQILHRSLPYQHLLEFSYVVGAIGDAYCFLTKNNF